MKPRTGSHHFSDLIDYNLQDETAIITPKKAKSDILRIAEVWGLAYYQWLTEVNYKPINKIIFDLVNVAGIKTPEKESFKRRISYLNLNNPFTLEIKAQNKIVLYSKDELENRPINEIITRKFPQRTSNDTPGRLEKDFQAFLFGGSILNNANTTTIINYEQIYRRLGVLGIDFYQLKKNFKLIREFPTGAFQNTVEEKNRILPTYYIDIVAFNKHGQLSIIELKLNDSKLHVISQILDYALFALSFRKQIIQSVTNHIGQQFCPVGFENKPIACYVANNYFHKRFDEISKYYAPQPKGFNWKFNKIVLGETTTI
jgi:hypothetical protein